MGHFGIEQSYFFVQRGNFFGRTNKKESTEDIHETAFPQAPTAMVEWGARYWKTLNSISEKKIWKTFFLFVYKWKMSVLSSQTA